MLSGLAFEWEILACKHCQKTSYNWCNWSSLKPSSQFWIFLKQFSILEADIFLNRLSVLLIATKTNILDSLDFYFVGECISAASKFGTDPPLLLDARNETDWQKKVSSTRISADIAAPRLTAYITNIAALATTTVLLSVWPRRWRPNLFTGYELYNSGLK